MPTISSMQAALPRCPGLSSNLSHNRTHRQPCGQALRWDHGAGFWTCLHHGPRLDGDQAAAYLLDPDGRPTARSSGVAPVPGGAPRFATGG